jgi:ABC-2 type transport system ATP-binding protein
MSNTSDTPLFELHNVSKRYGNLPALDDLSVTMQPGIIGLLGPNGAGKSTLIKSLLGLVRLTSGSASVLGLDVRRQGAAVRQRVGYMPEDDCIIGGLQGIEMVTYLGELAGLPSALALRRAHEMFDYVRLRDERYRQVETYSSGQRQRLRLAQALIHSPRLVFLDEPTSGIDPTGRQKLLKLISDLWHEKGVSVVLSTHLLHDVETICDTVLILGRGRVLVHDRLDALMQTPDNQVRVRIDGDEKAFQAALTAQGCTSESLPDFAMRVTRPEGPAGEVVLAAARDAGVAVREISTSQTSLEEIFVQAIQDGRETTTSRPLNKAFAGEAERF